MTNKQILQDAFTALEAGDGKPFFDCMDDEFSWTIIGTTPWSRTYLGKAEVQRELFRPLFAQFADRYTNRALRFIAEDDYVVIECRGQSTTKSGHAYNNSYCYVCRFADGKMVELTEYLDTALVEKALLPP
ncbi:MAG TPA: nuclear transport factor 2 family protein [Candidatus Acidoferrum sp.]|jgi:ketosteroid isomerase-like protein|nr:nuclear transport factor 2 family protein [Candidatus Acidoferrum sp.]